jgi:hypothetical protein
MVEVSYVIARWIQRYDEVELAPDSAAAKKEPIPKSPGPVMSPYELRLRLRKAVLT